MTKCTHKQLMTACMLAGTLMLGACTGTPPVTKEVSIVPITNHLEETNGAFVLKSNTSIGVIDAELIPAAEYLADMLSSATGYDLKVKEGEGTITLALGDVQGKEGAYTLTAESDKVNITGNSYGGVIAGIESLRQLFPPQIESKEIVKGTDWAIPAVNIQDAPRFEWRGIMLDVSRHFYTIDEVKELLDVMALYKMNKFHWHLTDDQGWRIEIKKYPRLTEVGAWRVDRTDVPFHSRRNPKRGEPTPIGGFYTQEDIREIVAYAADRQIEVIPEIDVPAHSNAALAAYPQLACPVVKDFIGVLPGLGGRNSEIIYCAGNDSVFTFLQDIFDEILTLFPSRYIHVGGDEARKTNWEKCPLCQKRMRKQHLANEEDLQGYFMKRISDYLRKKGREVIGWDELTNSSFLPEESIILGWQGMGTAALKAAEKGHRFIMTPARIMYLIRYQGPQWFEPVTYFGNNTLKDVFDYEPVQKDWKPEYESLLMGIQACMWTEFCNKPEDVDYLLFPRLAALAEVAWTPTGTKDWSGFLKRMDIYNAHLAEKGIVYARSMYNIQQTVTPVNGHLEVNLECLRPDVEIRYTLNGSNPAMSSHRYDGPIRVTKTQMVKAATFMNGKQMGETLELQLTWNKATAKPLLDNKKNEMLLVNGLRGSLKYTDFEWCNWSRNDSISFTIDLQSQEELNKLAIGCITNYGMGAHKPKMIRVEVSDDNRTYHTMGELNFSPKEIYLEGTFRNDYSIDMGGVSARYVRVTAEGAGICPDEHVRPGQEARVYFDEVIIE